MKKTTKILIAATAMPFVAIILITLLLLATRTTEIPKQEEDEACRIVENEIANPFSKVEIGNELDNLLPQATIIFRQAPYFKISMPERMSSTTDLEVTGKTLIIKKKRGYHTPYKDQTIVISAPCLSEIESKSTADLSIEGYTSDSLLISTATSHVYFDKCAIENAKIILHEELYTEINLGSLPISIM